MVNFFAKYCKYCLSALLLCCFLFTVSCHIDLFGLFGSTDLNKRLEEKDSFIFLTEADRTISLNGGNFSFIVVSDTHIENGNAFGLEKLEDVIAANTDIKFVVFNGDVTQYGTSQDIQTFKNIASSLNVPCYPVIGNHDVYFGNWPEWKKHIGSTRYRINGGNDATLLILDSANAYFGNEQLEWLEKELKTANGRVFVFTHTNLFVESPLELQQLTDTRERARIMSILKNKCDIMFMGHSHKQIIHEAGNVKYINTEDYHGKRTYCLVKVTGAGIEYKFNEL